jgi:hypothetical protein
LSFLILLQVNNDAWERLLQLLKSMEKGFKDEGFESKEWALRIMVGVIS